MVRPLPGSTINWMSNGGSAFSSAAAASPQPDQELAFVQAAPVAIPLLLIIAAGMAKSVNQPGQARQVQQLQEQFFHTLRGLRWVGSLTPQQHDNIKSELLKALKGGSAGIARFQQWLAQFTSGARGAQEASQNDWNVALKQARTSNTALVRIMQQFSSSSTRTVTSLREQLSQAQRGLKDLELANDGMKSILARPEAASLPKASRTTLEQVNGWVNTAKDFCHRLEQQIARLPRLGQETLKKPAPTVTTGSRVTHTRGGGSLTGDPAAKLEQQAREQYAKKLKEATAWVEQQRRNGSTLSDAELSKEAAEIFFGTNAAAGAIAKAVAAGGGVQGAKNGGVRAGSDAVPFQTGPKFYKSYLPLDPYMIPLLEAAKESENMLEVLRNLIQHLVERTTQAWMAARAYLDMRENWSPPVDGVVQSYNARMKAMEQPMRDAVTIPEGLQWIQEKVEKYDQLSVEMKQQYAELTSLLEKELPGFIQKENAELIERVLGDAGLVGDATHQAAVRSALESVFQQYPEPGTARLFRYMIALHMAVTSVLQNVNKASE